MNFVPEYPALDDTPRSHLPFSPCVKVGPFVFVSGQASVDATGKIVADTFEGEVRRSIENMRAVLKAAGCDLSDVVQTRNYVRDASDVAEFNRALPGLFQGAVSRPHHHHRLPVRPALRNRMHRRRTRVKSEPGRTS